MAGRGIGYRSTVHAIATRRWRSRWMLSSSPAVPSRTARHCSLRRPWRRRPLRRVASISPSPDTDIPAATPLGDERLAAYAFAPVLRRARRWRSAPRPVETVDPRRGFAAVKRVGGRRAVRGVVPGERRHAGQALRATPIVPRRGRLAPVSGASSPACRTSPPGPRPARWQPDAVREMRCVRTMVGGETVHADAASGAGEAATVRGAGADASPSDPGMRG